TSHERKTILHQEMLDILAANDNAWIAIQEIADRVHQRRIYRKRDGSRVESSQISARIGKYPWLFERLNGRVRSK
ncbi:MAG: hypothetical protein OXF73_00510, partial [Gammaproteobacteria bacterium]|nr:hypothetical protein [Gammaproteobacteria bacterium]